MDEEFAELRKGPGMILIEGKIPDHRCDYDWYDDQKIWICCICGHRKHLLTEVPERRE